MPRSLIRWMTVLAAGVGLLLIGLPAGATPGPVGTTPRTAANTDLVMTGTGFGQGVSGGIAPVGSGFDPVAGYPADVPAGFEPLNEGFAGIITAQSVGTGQSVQMFCIDIRTSTYPGIGYENGSWDASNVPNVGYVARILNDYYPHTAEPAAAPDNNVRAAAVQAAVWFFSDSYVLSADDPVRPYTAQVVAATIAAGPLVEPPPPNLTITPSSSQSPAGTPAGPFAVATDTGASISVTSPDGTMYADAGGTVPIANGLVVPSGQPVWLLPDGPGADTATLNARGSATVPSGNVYLYDGNTPGVTDAQRLILAEDSVVSTSTSAEAQFYETGSLVVNKTIDGPAAGQQGDVVIDVACDDGTAQTITIPAGTTGSVPTTIEGLPAGTVCTVTETTDGSNPTVTVATVSTGSPATIPADGIAEVELTDTYDPAPGSLLVTKTISGSAAGQQGDVVIDVSCDDDTAQTVTIPAGTTGSVPTTIEGLPAGTVCTVTETTDGSSPTVDVTVVSEGSPATIPAGGQAAVEIADVYDPAPGSLLVAKLINGSAAADRGEIVIHVSCSNGFEVDGVIPPGEDGAIGAIILPAGTICEVTEPVDGSTPTVVVTGVISGSPAAVPAGGVAEVLITNTYEPAPGQLAITKTIAGSAAGQQGAITVHVSCTNSLEQDLVLIAGATGDSTALIEDMPAGTVCTVTEPVDGSSSTVLVTTASTGSPATIPAGGVAAVNLTNTYQLAPGSLVVAKTITGAAAGQQGAVRLHVSCTNGLTADVNIPAGSVGDSSTTFPDIPAGSVCSVTETADGSSNALSITVSGLGSATIAAAQSSTIHVVDSYQKIKPLAYTGTSGATTYLADASLLLMASGAVLLILTRRRAHC